MKAQRRHRQEVSHGNTAHQESAARPGLGSVQHRPGPGRPEPGLVTAHGRSPPGVRSHPVPVHRRAPQRVPARHPALFLHRQAHPRQDTGRAARLPEPVPHGERGRLHAPVGQCTGGRLRPLRRRRTQWARLDARRWRPRVLHLQCNSSELPSLLRQRRPRRGFSPPDLCRPARARRPLG